MNTKRLANLPLFDGLDEDSLRAIAAAADEVSVSEGTALVREGDYAYDLTIIDEGTASVVHDGAEVATLGPGDVFGETALLRKDVRNATVTATSDMRLITLSGWDLRRLRNREPQLVERLERIIAERAPAG